MIDRNDAITIINILLTVDGDCSYCAQSLCYKFIESFGYANLTKELYMNKFGCNLGECGA